MLASVLLGVAEMEQENRRERQAVGIEIAKAIPGQVQRSPQGSVQGKNWRRVGVLRERGLTAPEIASAMGISRNTVFEYLRHLRVAT